MRVKRHNAMVQSSPVLIRSLIGRFLRDEQGATAIEYALIASGVSIVIMGAVVALGGTVTGMFQSVATALQ
jgi:pilus assembly protein Flp/PilA